LGQPPGSQIETAAATVEPVCGKNGLGLVMAENPTEQLTHSGTPSHADIGTSCVMVYVPPQDAGFAAALDHQLSQLGPQELRRLFFEHVSDWSELEAVKISPNGMLLGSTADEPAAGAAGCIATVRIPIPTLLRAVAAASPSRPLQKPELSLEAVRVVGAERNGPSRSSEPAMTESQSRLEQPPTLG
jgi:hypothetical protein